MPNLCVIPGDGIGKEVIPAAVDLLKAVVPGLNLVMAEAGWECFLRTGTSLPEATKELMRECRAGIFGAVSSPAKKVEGYRSTILQMRQSFDLYANIRPVWSLPRVSPRGDVDMIIFRENTEGLYSGIEYSDGEKAVAERVITRRASRRLAECAVRVSRQMHRKKITIVHKANVLPITDGLFRDTVRTVLDEHQKNGLIEVEELLVDVAAMKMVSSPQDYDVIITTNLFGDILSDAAAPWCGGLGLAPSINLGDDMALAEPVHGSAPDIAGKGIANPIAAILSSVLLLRYQWNMMVEADRIEKAVIRTLEQIPLETGGRLPAGMQTTQMVDIICKNIPKKV